MDLSNLSLASIRNQLDEVRAQVYPRNETERKVYDALSSKNWGASSTLLNDIAAESMDYEKFGIIMTVIWDNMDTDGRSWKQIFKTLTLIEFLIKNGSERVIEVTRNRIHKIRTLEDFSYFEGNVDKGSGVREKSKIICELLSSNDMLRSEREKARSLRNKFIGISNDGRNSGFSGGNNYDNSNFSAGRYNDNGGSGNNTWSNNGGGGNSYSDSGGSYDNNRSSQSRHNDSYNSQGHGSSNSHSSNSHNKSKENADYFEEVKAKSTAKTAAVTKPLSAPVSTGKLKVSIKKAPVENSTSSNERAAPVAAAAVTNKSKPVEVDLFTFDDPVPTAPTPAPVVPTSNPTAFDPFGNSSAPVTQHQSQQVQNNFDPFGASNSAPTPPRVPTSVPFDPFSAQPQQQQYGHTAAAPTPPKPTFDPFSQPQQQQYARNSFNPVPSPVVNNNTFDPFAAGNHQPQHHQPQQQMSQFQSAPAVPVMNSTASMYNSGPNPQGQIVQQQQPMQQPQPFLSLQQPTTQQYSGAMYPKGYNPQQQPLGGSMSPRTYNSHQQPQPQAQSQQQNQSQSSANDFGEFESASNKGTTAASPAVNSQWGDLGKLVDLSGIAKNENKAAKAAAASSYSAASFKGLDGFSKSQAPNTVGSTPNPYTSGGGGSSPMMYAAQQQPPQQPAMLIRQPSGMMPSAGMVSQQGMGMSAMYPPQPPMIPQQQQQMPYGGGMQQQPMMSMGMGMQQQPMMMQQQSPQQPMMAPNYGMNNNMPPQSYPPRGAILPGGGGW